MTRLACLFALFASLLSLLPQPASAGNVVTYVAGDGSDTNNDCSFFYNPCKTMNQALSNLNDNGAVVCVRPGYFGGVNITQSVTIDCKLGGGSGNLSFLGINAAGKVIRLRNLVITGAGLGLIGITINTAGLVDLDNVMLSGGNIGILDQRTQSGELLIRNSQITGNRSSSNPQPGIVIAPSGSTVNAILDHVITRDNTYGVAVGRGGRVQAIHSVFSHNSVAGVESDSGGIIEIHDALISGNGTGIIANAGSQISVSNTSLESNNTGISGLTQSFGNNRFVRNASSDGTPPTAAGSPSAENGQR